MQSYLNVGREHKLIHTMLFNNACNNWTEEQALNNKITVVIKQLHENSKNIFLCLGALNMKKVYFTCPCVKHFEWPLLLLTVLLSWQPLTETYGDYVTNVCIQSNTI